MNYITGSSGFVGSHLIKSLKNVEAIPHQEISTKKLKPFDNFYFLSTYGNMAFHDDDEKIIQANVLDLVNMSMQAKRLDFNSFVFMSTSSVRLKYQTLYSRTKRASEEILLALTEKHSLPFCIVRPYSITGVGEQPQHLIPTLIRSCLAGELMSFVPGPVHDFIDVSDVVNAIMILSKERAKGIFEVGSEIAYTNQQVREIVERITGKKANIKQVGRLRNYDTDQWVCKNCRVRNFGWLPKKSLEQSIAEMVKEYERFRKKNN